MQEQLSLPLSEKPIPIVQKWSEFEEFFWGWRQDMIKSKHICNIATFYK